MDFNYNGRVMWCSMWFYRWGEIW